MFKKILIANRGDVALRVLRACQELQIPNVVVHSTADADSMPVRLADESVCIGPPSSADSYLNVASIVTAAGIAGADAVHPGVGFLAENADFAEIVAAHGLTFIGPEPRHIRSMGDKVEAKITAAEAGLPLVPGSPGAVATLDEATRIGADVGYPLLVKAASGGGGRGMKVAESEAGLAEAFSSARAEAKAAFGDDTVYLERYLGQPRHIEVQVIADSHGNVVHLGERECSIQRRHQKLFEEAPSPVLTAEQRAEIGGVAAEATRRMGYLGVGTMEFLYENGEFFFIEMNTRLQVEHPITEAITGVDLVREQIRIAAGMPLSFTQEDVTFTGHAIECRINAEHPETFMPTPGRITAYHAAGGPGIRVDSCLYAGYSVPPYYDSLIAKLIVYGDDRAHCLARLKRALQEFVVEPIPTTLDLHERLVDAPAVLDGSYNIRWLEEHFLSDDKA
ncbi:MAG: acetyl-CoA carboxylase biotin carboxylase subunit [Pseudomonadota bacterium]|nr:acetyl-CoA carboxylase biotin carboxylase subunit [Pseudomonadota bacterium]MEC7650617.1 acetyl-CoA carboxylase biotin carboxylase subunit [Pseudomonadota bacterium]MEC7852214.1 acetyl-CoA carboxylase biotin carboxylase subunit [Pseudomonadota bacterium]MEC8309198.1 acetyl-CoA carboxylase biotin carboxylase subunit [Pseudomonadota bacterium]MEC8515623.1 acetyl-CoA carboxylase biotin carboxylase subunit [Pseudomonadota bacterium]